MPRLGGTPVCEMHCDIGGNGGSTASPGGEAVLRVQRAHLFAFRIAEHRQVDGARNMVLGEFGGRPHVNDRVVSATADLTGESGRKMD